MGLHVVSQSSLLVPHPRSLLRFRTKIACSTTPTSFFRRVDSCSSSPLSISRVRPGLVTVFVSDSKSPESIIESSAVAVGEEAFDRPDSSGGDRFGGGNSGGRGKGGGGNNNDNNSEGEDESDSKKISMSMSQKLTLGYAVLVGLGGVMGYLKSGSQKSLLAGGLSASLLFYVYSQLPASPTFASSIGLGISAALLLVMGSRFKNSGKVFPAGVVSLVSLVMTGGYLHGIMRGMH